MCEFCEKENTIGNEIETSTGHWAIFRTKTESGMYYRHRDCSGYCGISINYCPMCGKKLTANNETLTKVETVMEQYKDNFSSVEEYENAKNLGVKLWDNFMDFWNAVSGVSKDNLEERKE